MHLEGEFLQISVCSTFKLVFAWFMIRVILWDVQYSALWPEVVFLSQSDTH